MVAAVKQTDDLGAKIRAAFPEGTVVEVKASEVNSYIATTSSKIKNRVGRVTGYTYPHADEVCVTFCAVGRRKEHKMRFSNAMSYLDIVSDEERLSDYAAAETKANDAAWERQIEARRKRA